MDVEDAVVDVKDDEDIRSKRSGYTATSPVSLHDDFEIFAKESRENVVQTVQQDEQQVPFRALDLLEGTPRFRRDHAFPPGPISAALGSVPSENEVPVWPETPLETFDADVSQLHEAAECLESVTDESVEIIEPDARAPSDPGEEVPDLDVVAPLQTWNEMVSNSFAQFRAVPDDLRFR
eukprot:s1864_g17.t1